MKAFIGVSGDPSVGIPSTEFAAEVPDFEDDEDRALIRAALTEAYSDICGERVKVAFADECVECGKRESDCVCKYYDGRDAE